MLRSKTSNTTTKPAEQKSLPHQYASNHFKFCKEYNASGTSIINSQSDYYYKVSRPDSIRFSQGSELETMLERFELYRLPMDYSPESGQYEIHAKHAVAFLNALITLKNKEGDKVIYGKTEFESLLKDLNDNHYLSNSEVDHFKKLIPTELILEERERLAEENRDFKAALALAILYKNNPHEISIWGSSHAFFWLRKVLEFKPSNIQLEDEINLKEFFSAFTRLSCPYFFNEQNQIFLKILKENTTIKDIVFSRDDSDTKYVNQFLADFIAVSKTIESLDINAGFWQRDRLDDVHMDYIAYGLRFNTSLKELSLAGHPIKDDGLIILLESLKANPYSKLYKLNLAETSLTDIGAKALIEFLKQNKTLTWINLNLNSNICKELITEIDKLTERNKLVIEYDKHRKAIAMIEPQNVRRYQEKNGSTKTQDILYHHACIHAIQEKLGIYKKIKEHKKAIAMIEPQNARRFAERNCLFRSKDQALAYHRTCLRELSEPVLESSPKLK